MKLLYITICSLLLSSAIVCCSSGADEKTEPVPTPPKEEIVTNALQLNADKTNDLKVSVNSKGEFSLRTTGSDPWICTVPLDRTNPDNTVVLTFEYKASKDVAFQIFFAQPLSGDRMEEYATIEASPSCSSFGLSSG
ncbi:MAG: hypothetical protein K2K30_09215, partial [Alistipes sp.]|nr:hypothetical protein [Alistipes sp.]